jgi:triosephosphate isomerase
VTLAEVASRVRERAGAKEKTPLAEEILVGAQNIHSEFEGAFTGEISAAMVRSAGGNAVILGHSERRHIFGEEDEDIAPKVLRALETDLRPILCVGEKIEERDAGKTMEVVRRQFTAGIALLKEPSALSQVTLAYEPVWAIGTGRTATPDQAQEVHAFLRGELSSAFKARGGSPELAEEIRILYGGSVKPENAQALLAQLDIDGALVGGASLRAESFLGICRGCYRET